MLRNDAPNGSRGQGTVVWADDRDPITTPQGDCQRDRARNLLTALRAEYPVFREYLPLALRIREALHAAFPDATRTAVIHALARHCRSDRYIRALASGGSRYDLAGVPSGEVSEGHRAAAVLVLARRAEKSVKPRNPPRAPVASAAPKPPRLAKPGRPA